MGFDVVQFRSVIERVLGATDPELNTPAAVELLLGTAAQESHLGTYLYQRRGPAKGVFQIEPTTFEWLRDHFDNQYPILKERRFDELETDLRLQIIIARLRYRIVREALPDPTSPMLMAAYWLKYYNGNGLGKGNVEDFVANYNRLVLKKEAA